MNNETLDMIYQTADREFRFAFDIFNDPTKDDGYRLGYVCKALETIHNLYSDMKAENDLLRKRNEKLNQQCDIQKETQVKQGEWIFTDDIIAFDTITIKCSACGESIKHSLIIPFQDKYCRFCGSMNVMKCGKTFKVRSGK